MMTSITSTEQINDESEIVRIPSTGSVQTTDLVKCEDATKVTNEIIVLSDATICPSSSGVQNSLVPVSAVETDLNKNEEANDFRDSNAFSSPRKRHRHQNKTDLKPRKKERILECDRNICSEDDVIPSDVGVKMNVSAVSKRGRKRISDMLTSSVNRDMEIEPKTGEMQLSLSDSKLEENFFIPKDSEETSSEKTDADLTPVKKVRNPYGRKGKPTGVKLTVSNQGSNPKRINAVSRSRVKVDYSKPDWVNPEWLKPFQEGWRREIVYRNAGLSSTSGRKCDIYYFTPDNQKLRSTPEISSYLSSLITELTLHSFTFVKNPIYHEPDEFVRTAAVSGKRGGLSDLQSKVQKTGKKTKSLKEKLDSASKKPSIKLKIKCTNIQTSNELLLNENTASSFQDVTEINADGTQLTAAEEIEKITANEENLPQEIIVGDILSVNNKADLSEGRHLSDSMPTVDTAKLKTSGLTLSLIKNSKNLKWKPKKSKKLKRLIKFKRISKSLSESPPVSKDIRTENSDVYLPMLAEEEPVQNVSKVEDDETSRKAEVGSENVDLPAEVQLEKTLLTNPPGDVDQNTEEETQKSSSALSVQTVLNVVNSLDDRTLNVKSFSSKRVAKKSTASKAKFSSSSSQIRLRMSYKDGLPSKNLTGKKSSPSVYELDQNSVSCFSFYPVSNTRPCGLHCAGQFGMAPSLHCDICMCMFHPECVGVSHIPHRTSFTCKACCSVNEDVYDSVDVDDLLESSFTSSQSLGNRNPAALNDSWQKSNTSMQSFISPGVFSSFSDHSFVTNRLNERNDGAGIVSLNAVDNEKPSGRILTLPMSMISLLDLSKPIKLSLNGRKYVVPTNCQLLTESGLRVFLPHDSFAAASRQGTVTSAFSPKQTVDQNFSQAVTVPPGKNLSVLEANDSSQNSLLNSLIESNCKSADSISTGISFNQSANDTNIEERLLVRSPAEDVRDNEIQAEESHMPVHTTGIVLGAEVALVEECSDQNCRDVTMKTDILLRIFKFLNLVNLLKASKVCTSWKKVSETPLLWKSVKFDDVAVHDWELAANHLTKYKTTHLDLSRLIHGGSENQTWHQLTGIFSSLTTIRHLVFGPCPPNLLYCAASKITSLESLKAVQITDALNDIQTNGKRFINTKLDIGKVAVLKNLVKLELRGLHGLILSSHSFTCGLSELGHLSELKYLSLTSLRDVADDQFNFFSRLEKLKVLEIGDCKLWTKKTYEQLGHLKCLQRLKLENGIELSDDGLGTVLLNLTKLEHLELFCFIVSKPSAELFATMNNFEILSLSLEANEKTSHSNSYLLTSIQRMTFLKKLSWNVIHSDSRSPTVTPVNCEMTSCSYEEKILPFSSETEGLQPIDLEPGRQNLEWKSMAEVEAILRKSLVSTDIHFTHS